MSRRIASPWPDSTPAPTAAPSIPSSSSPPKVLADVPPTRSLKRKKLSVELEQRQDDEGLDWDAIDEATNRCGFAGNDVVSCYPTAGTTFNQNSYVTFVWNSNLPAFTQTNSVNIYLYHADSQEEMFVFHDVQNPSVGIAGLLNVPINDTWWPNAWSGNDDTYPYYFKIKRSDQELDGSDTSLALFSAVQTTYANSVIASMSSASSASSAASASSLTATSSAQTTGTPTSSSVSGVVTTTDSNGGPITYTTNSDGVPTDSNGNPLPTDSNGVPTSTGSVQDGAGSGGFPNWAIAVIVVLGFLALVFACLLTFFICRRIRRRREMDNSQRNSMGSSTPMMANAPDSTSPLMSPTSHSGHGLGAAAAGAGIGGAAGAYSQDRHSSINHDAASTISAGDTGPFSGADAAIMADAFRKALRKPDFAEGPLEEGESPEHEDGRTTPTGPPASGMLSRELAEEGRDIRSVSSSRGVRIEGSEDGASTVHHDY